MFQKTALMVSNVFYDDHDNDFEDKKVIYRLISNSNSTFLCTYNNNYQSEWTKGQALVPKDIVR